MQFLKICPVLFGSCYGHRTALVGISGSATKSASAQEGGELPGVSRPPASFNTNTVDFPSDPPRRKPPARLNSAQNRYSPSAVRLVTLLPGKSVSLESASSN